MNFGAQTADARLIALAPDLATLVLEAEKAMSAAVRALEDAERIIESRSGKDSWVGSLNLEKARAWLARYQEVRER